MIERRSSARAAANDSLAPEVAEVEVSPRAEADTNARAGSLPFARLAAAHVRVVRRPAVARIAVFVSLAVLALVALAGVFRSVRIWLHGQPSYQLAFREIALDPPPPAWIRSGRAGLLEQVRQAAGQPALLPTLELDLAALERAFKLHCPWVEKVERIERHAPAGGPPAVVVHLRYREPVAEVRWSDSHKAVVIDHNAVVLPLDDLDRAHAGSLLIIDAKTAPANLQPGHYVSAATTDEHAAQPDATLAAAARLAWFFKQKQASASSSDKTRPRDWSIVAINPNPRGILFAQASDDTQILWPEPPGAEPPGTPAADQKWTFLIDWLNTQKDPRVPHPDFLEFTMRGVRRHSEASAHRDRP